MGKKILFTEEERKRRNRKIGKRLARGFEVMGKKAMDITKQEIARQKKEMAWERKIYKEESRKAKKREIRKKARRDMKRRYKPRKKSRWDLF